MAAMPTVQRRVGSRRSTAPGSSRRANVVGREARAEAGLVERWALSYWSQKSGSTIIGLP